MRGTPLEQVYIDAWIESGDVQLALEAVRESEMYSQFFMGNVRDDGTVRYDENTYLSIKDSYRNTLLSINVNPDLFEQQFGVLISGDVSPGEFLQRVESIYSGVIDQAPQIMEYYADRFGFELTPSAIIADLMDPDVGQQILEGKIAIAQVGGSASQFGFDIDTQFAQSLVHAGVQGGGGANQFFGLAQGVIPTLSALAARHADPDDDFDLAEFSAAQIFADPEQRQRMRRLLSQESASFTQGSGAAGPIARSEGGRRVGLETR
jgi:hypothetical protein